ncbi:phospho-N-acetylmuramoyl-pentapeptide-transferase [Hippea maritima]|uniref:Phospho-N-acetylmuramoyl-pentapeptide-transferase n=1 Tax=Hippea maritima (strain ATCC 700847 / DSM 10411 / MH2) TaxID=760142 RepID=F2LTV2_HIPMA|nr:phospho-N-acetylmuramoyl-pentapeptide-transferase [Hippea maritima]AEA34478.1 Phospho-N-acetylmuramoyl-pentapeptide-transferase [Hippea maritima DSM 10411]
MFYYIFYQKLTHIFSPFNVFHYITFRMIMASLTALGLSLWFGKILIPKLKSMQFEDSFKGYEPQTHKQKSGTPTVGGLIIWSGFFVSALMWIRFDSPLAWIVLLGSFLFMLIGFLDDFLKIKRGKNNGLKAKTKFFLQTIVALVVAFMIFRVEQILTGCAGCFYLPFIKHGVFDLGYFYLAVAVFVIVGSSNAVNLTDGLDGLATGPSLTTIFSLTVFAYATGNAIFAYYLHLPHVVGSGEISVLLAALAGSLLGFLWYNCYPAEVFMGDTGSLALGGFLGIVAVAIKEEVVLAIAGGIFVLETLSVIIQVASYKTRGERIFKMAPIHHHFELKGWPESKVIVRFWIISLVLALLSLTALKLR